MATPASSHLLRPALVYVSLVVLCSCAWAKTIYVDSRAHGANTGANWTDAYVCLQDALAEGRSPKQPVEIRVAQGTYRPDVGAGYTGGDDTATFEIPAGTVLLGGFAGTQADSPDTRAPRRYRTTLSGDLRGDDLPILSRGDFVSGPAAQSRSDNAQHVVKVWDAERTIVIDGFAIAGGYCSSGGRHPVGYGGGIYSLQSNLVVRNCTLEFNFASTKGGALYCEGRTVRIEGCTFDRNGARGELTGCGGAIGCAETSLTVSDSLFIANLSGALAASDCEGVSVSNCLFAGNVSNACASAVTSSACHLIVTQCTFDENGPYRTLRAGGTPEEPGMIDISGCIFPLNEPLLAAQSPVDMAISYSNVTRMNTGVPDIAWGAGNVEVDPHFAAPGYWDPNGTPGDAEDDFWVDGDYHLKSEAGRWDPTTESWGRDDVTSPCVDAGDPEAAVAFEMFPNGGVVNLGAYGGTAEASKSASSLHARYGGGSGSADDPYLIYTAEHLNALGANREDWSAHFQVRADIDLHAYPAGVFNPIGSYPDTEPFRGTFDGNGHTIANFQCDEIDGDGVGFFGFVMDSAAEIRDLTLADPNVQGRRANHVGALVGYLLRGAVMGCHVTNALVTGGEDVGGLVGLSKTAAIAACSSTGSISAQSNVGGLVGYNVSGTIEDCCAAATVSGQNDVGGLVGDTLDGAIARCYCSGSVTGWGADIGGLIGDNFGALSDCYSIADVTATPYGLSVGGLAGENAGGWAVIENCYAAGRVTAEADSTDVGGLVGTNAGAVRHCFWDTQATGQATSAAGTGRTTAELQTLATFLEAGWDFVEESDNGTADIWYLLEHWDYPRLAWDLPADLP